MKTHSAKSGGNVQKNVSDLLVPFGLMLAKESLETFLKKQDSDDDPMNEMTNDPKSVKQSSMSRSSKSGGGSCGSYASSSHSAEGGAAKRAKAKAKPRAKTAAAKPKAKPKAKAKTTAAKPKSTLAARPKSATPTMRAMYGKGTMKTSK